MLGFQIKFVCTRCGRKLSPVDAYEHATIAVRRKCGKCHRWFSLVIVPLKLKQGWAHKATITEIDRPVKVLE